MSDTNQSTKQSADFFSAAGFASLVMSELAELRAKKGFCPKCQVQKLRHISCGGGMVFRQCADCWTVVVTADK